MNEFKISVQGWVDREAIDRQGSTRESFVTGVVAGVKMRTLRTPVVVLLDDGTLGVVVTVPASSLMSAANSVIHDVFCAIDSEAHNGARSIGWYPDPLMITAAQVDGLNVEPEADE